MNITYLHAHDRQGGFSLVAAIFILVILALLGAFMLTMSVIERSTSSYAVQGARAYQAALSGIEWGVRQALTGSSCPASPTTFPLTATGLNGFSVTVQCTSSDHVEPQSDPGTFKVYVLTSTAATGTYGQPDYFSRSAQATITGGNPP